MYVAARRGYSICSVERRKQVKVAPTDRVLVIDDDALMRELLSLLLGAEGYVVATADSGESALAMLADTPRTKLPGVVLTDLKMPGVSHAALAMGLRVTCPSPAVIVAMSASEPDAEVSAYDAFLRKPFNVAEYKAAAANARSRTSRRPLNTKRMHRISASAEEDAAPRVLNEEIYDKMAVVMGADELSPLYTMFMDDAVVRLHKMSAAVVNGDEAIFIREAHAIKGGCGMLGATEMYSLARRMEVGGLACSSLLDNFRPALERLQRILIERRSSFS